MDGDLEDKHDGPLRDPRGMAALAVADRIAVLHGSEVRVLGCSGEVERLLPTIKLGLLATTEPEQ